MLSGSFPSSLYTRMATFEQAIWYGKTKCLKVLSVREASLTEGTTLGKLCEGMAIQTLRTAKTIQQAIERIMWMVPSLLR